MPGSEAFIAAGMLSGGGSENVYVAVTPANRPPKPANTPGEPSTLTLALVGIFTIGVWLIGTGWRPWRGNRTVHSNTRIYAGERRNADEKRQQKRGAA
jgi:hypothetical protein